MRCEDARTLLLEADMAALDPDGASPLSAHLRACAPCAAAAREVRRETEALDAFLDAGGAPVPEEAVDAILARLERTGVPASGKATEATPIPSAARRWRTSPWIPLAMAAGVAALYFVARSRTPGPGEALPAVASAPSLPLVESSGAATVAVIQTDNPDITVLWFF